MGNSASQPGGLSGPADPSGNLTNKYKFLDQFWASLSEAHHDFGSKVGQKWVQKVVKKGVENTPVTCG